MTTSTATPVRRRIRQKAERLTGAADLREAILQQLEETTRIRFPSDRYRDDPVAFCREILGIEPWAKQVEILESVRDNMRVAVSSGHKCGKSMSAAMLALWYYCSFPNARAIMSSTTARQVDQILWRELKMVRSRAGKCLACKTADPEDREIPRPCPHSALIEGDIGELARTGLKSPDFREVFGFTAREAEAVAGISGANLLYLIDEASGVPPAIFEAIEGNRAAGARIVMMSNPTKTTGEFFEAFHSKRAFYHCITVSSEETPNVAAGRAVVPGLAGRAWIEEKRQEWGEDSPLYKIRVKGEFALSEDGKIFSTHAIEQAEQRWHETPEIGRLFIGLDPAGPQGSGDETVFAVRRGCKLIELVAHRGLTDEAHLVHLIALVNKHKATREIPVVVLDREGSIGSSLYGIARDFCERNRGAFELVAVRASDRAHRQPMVYDRQRDALAANLEAWFRDGGAIPEDVKLAGELHALEWEQHANGRLKVTRKDRLRKELGRSPDRYDALALACWEPISLRDESPKGNAPEADDDDGPGPSLDPYASADFWGRR